MKKIALTLLTLFGLYASAAEPTYLDNEDLAKEALETMLERRYKLQANPNNDADFFVEGYYDGNPVMCGYIRTEKRGRSNYYCKVVDKEVEKLFADDVPNKFAEAIKKSNGSYSWKLTRVRERGNEKSFNAEVYFSHATADVLAHVVNGKINYVQVMTVNKR